VARLRLATHYQDRTHYHTLVAFGQQAQFAAEYLTKGRLVHAEGRLQARQWTAEDGTQRRTHEVVVNRVQPLGPRPQRAEAETGEAER
jgi:single-strand DNA-binding protein